MDNLLIFEKTLSIEDFLPDCRGTIMDYKCPLCDGIAFKPIADDCGHIFCAKCFQTHLRSNQNICPVTNTVLKSDTMNKIKIVTDILNKQMIICKNKKKGCDWTGKLSELEDHISMDCQKQKIKCTNEKCSQFILREDKEKHMNECNYRSIKCIYCSKEFPFKLIIGHEENCPKMKVYCPQQCSTLIFREDIQVHIDEDCMNSEIICPYIEFGCSKRLLRHDLSFHLEKESVSHSLSSLRKIEAMSKTIDSLMSYLLNNTSTLNRKIDQLITSNHQSETKEIISPVCFKTTIVREVDYQVIPKVSQLSSKNHKLNKEIKSKQEVIIPSLNNATLELDNNIERTIKDSPLYLGKKTWKEPEILKNQISNKSFIEKKEKSVFDVEIVSKGICIAKNNARCVTNPNKEHLYVIGSMPISKDNFKWKVTVITFSGWIGIGVCCKDTISKNNSHPINQIKTPKHGAFCISTNGYSWNSNNQSENNLAITDFPLIQNGDKFKLSYSFNLKELRIRLKYNKKIKLRNVYADPKDTLTPCIILLTPDDEVKLEYYS